MCICNAYLQTLEMKTYCKCLSHLWCALMPQHARVYASLTNYSEVIPMPMLLLLFTKSRCSHLRQNRNALPFLRTGALCCLQIHLEYLQKNTGSHRNIKKNKQKKTPEPYHGPVARDSYSSLLSNRLLQIFVFKTCFSTCHVNNSDVCIFDVQVH